MRVLGCDSAAGASIALALANKKFVVVAVGTTEMVSKLLLQG